MAASRLHWVLSADDDHAVVAFSGELDMASIAEFEQGFAAALARGTPTVVVDLRSLGFIDSSGVHALIEAKRTEGRRVLVGPVGEAVMRILSVLGLEEQIDVPSAPVQDRRRRHLRSPDGESG